MIYFTTFSVILTMVAGFFYFLGYAQGYKGGLAYGMKRLEEYHQHTLKGIKEL